MEDVSCSLCLKKQQNSKIFVEVNLEVFPRYQREDGSFENMNGLWKKTAEYFCEDCFAKYSDMLEKFYQTNSRKK